MQNESVVEPSSNTEKTFAIKCKAKNPVVDNFDMAKTELKKYSIEARENVRFLSTLERHFKESGKKKVVWATLFLGKFQLGHDYCYHWHRIFNIQMILELYSIRFLP